MIGIKSGFVAGGILLALAATSGGTAAAVTAKNLKCKGCVQSKDLGKSSVTSEKIRNNSVYPSHLSSSAKPGGVALGGPTLTTSLSGPDEVIQTITVKAPGPGFVVATANLSFNYNGISSSALCDVTTATIHGINHALGSGTGIVPVSLTRTIPVTKAGNIAINLVCAKVTGTVTVYNASIGAIFLPALY
jgi:hypothetical protein